MKNIPKNKDVEDKDKTVGTTVQLYIRGFNGDNPIDGKVDTGAEMCSLHAGNIEVFTDDVASTSVVTFEYNDYRYKMNVEGIQAVSSADGGTTNRPYVLLDVRINDILVQDVIFNLNDRSNMDYTILVGMNLLKEAKLLINPALKEMEINFGPDGMDVVHNDLPVDNNVEKSDTGSSNFDQPLLIQYLTSVKDAPFTEILNDVLQSWNKLNATSAE